MVTTNSARLSLTDERDEALYEEYQRVISGYGDMAPYIAKSKLYEEAARKFFISPGRARNIISEIMRKKTGMSNVRG